MQTSYAAAHCNYGPLVTNAAFALSIADTTSTIFPRSPDLTNTWQIDGLFVRFVARRFAIDKIANPNDFT